MLIHSQDARFSALANQHSIGMLVHRTSQGHSFFGAAEARRRPDFKPVGWLRNQLLHTINRNQSSLAAHDLNAREWLVYSFMARAGKRFALLCLDLSGEVGHSARSVRILFQLQTPAREEL